MRHRSLSPRLSHAKRRAIFHAVHAALEAAPMDEQSLMAWLSLGELQRQLLMRASKSPRAEWLAERVADALDALEPVVPYSLKVVDSEVRASAKRAKRTK